MPDTLPVHVNRSSLHSLEVPDRFETDGSFDVRLINHGEPIHVHLHLDDALSDLASIEAPNHHVDRESARAVRVTVHEPGSVFGKLKVATSYGSETRYVDIDLSEPTESETSVEVDESLSKPQPEDDRGANGTDGDQPTPAGDGGADLPLPVLGLGAVAVVLAVAVAAILDGPAAWAGALVVVGALAGAAYVLVTG